MYKALVFDFDFTLGDSAAGIAASINYALGRLGYPEKEMEAIKKDHRSFVKKYVYRINTKMKMSGKRTCLPDISGKKQMRS